MITQIQQMISMKVSLQVSRSGTTNMYRIMLLEDGDGCEGVDVPVMISEWVGLVKTGGFFMVHDLRSNQKTSGNGALEPIARPAWAANDPSRLSGSTNDLSLINNEETIGDARK